MIIPLLESLEVFWNHVGLRIHLTVNFMQCRHRSRVRHENPASALRCGVRVNPREIADVV